MNRLVGEFDRIWLLNDPPDYEPAPEHALDSCARRLGRDPLDLAYDLRLENGGRQRRSDVSQRRSDGCFEPGGREFESRGAPNKCVAHDP
jgi:CO/xanthine dehydrogenase Mo-binding subunit